MNRNYQRELERILADMETGQNRKKLFLHSCCAPCSSYVLEYLSQYVELTVFYYNPNITDEKEYQRRLAEQRRLLGLLHRPNEGQPIRLQTGKYEPERFFQAVKGLEACPEGGERCLVCYRLRLEETARQAKEQGMDYFTTTLSISPLKKAEKLDEIAKAASEKYGIAHLPSDFKKKDGYKRSLELSADYGLYRQDYCGCIYSLRK